MAILRPVPAMSPIVPRALQAENDDLEKVGLAIASKLPDKRSQDRCGSSRRNRGIRPCPMVPPIADMPASAATVGSCQERPNREAPWCGTTCQRVLAVGVTRETTNADIAKSENSHPGRRARRRRTGTNHTPPRHSTRSSARSSARSL